MRAVVQRVSEATVSVEGEIIASIGCGLLVFLGLENADAEGDAEWLAGKIAHMRILDDGKGRMNRSLIDNDGQAIVVSQFTLHASTRKGNRPSSLRAAGPDRANPLYEHFCTLLDAHLGRTVGRGRFGAMMKVALVNDGPVTIVIDSRNRE